MGFAPALQGEKPMRHLLTVATLAMLALSLDGCSSSAKKDMTPNDSAMVPDATMNNTMMDNGPGNALMGNDMMTPDTMKNPDGHRDLSNKQQ